MIVTDSSAYLPPDLVATHPIRVIPLKLNWDGQTYRDGVDIQATEFYNACRNPLACRARARSHRAILKTSSKNFWL